MVIRTTGPGGPQQTQALEGTTAKSTDAPKAEFSTAVSAPERASASAAPQRPIEQAVHDIAAQVRSGAIPRDGAVDAVIERYITGTAAPGAPASETRERLQVARTALGDDPVFVMRLERMLTRELG